MKVQNHEEVVKGNPKENQSTMSNIQIIKSSRGNRGKEIFFDFPESNDAVPAQLLQRNLFQGTSS